jgi:excisionase family DNA binding protein
MNEENAERTMYTLKEVRNIVKVSYPTILGLIRSNKLRAIRVGGRWRVAKEELDRLIRDGNFEVKE